MIVIDDKIVVIGSHNYSFTAFAANREKSVIINSTELADRLEMVFEKDRGAICFLANHRTFFQI